MSHPKKVTVQIPMPCAICAPQLRPSSWTSAPTWAWWVLPWRSCGQKPKYWPWNRPPRLFAICCGIWRRTRCFTRLETRKKQAKIMVKQQKRKDKSITHGLFLVLSIPQVWPLNLAVSSSPAPIRMSYASAGSVWTARVRDASVAGNDGNDYLFDAPVASLAETWWGNGFRMF